MNIVLTGVTGIIGREVLAELILRKKNGEQIERIICTARSTRQGSAAERVKQILQKTAEELGVNEQTLASYISIVDTTSDKDGCYKSLLAFLSGNNINEVYALHLASTTNLSPLALTEEEIYRDSYLPTLQLLNALLPRLKQYSFMSTAFSCGHQQGLIPNEYFNLPVNTNRNYYERFKLMAEKRVKQICEERGIKWQVLRSGIVSGRLMRQPYYYTPKFNVFYAWTGFFASLKANGINCDGIRIVANPNSGLNIISSDYVAGATVKAFFNSSISELNLIHSRNLENTFLIPTMLNSVGIRNFEWVSTIPEQLSLAEKMYYKTAGLQFSPYLNTHTHQYNSTKVREVMAGVPEPDIAGNFVDILNYAVEKNFKSEVV